MAKLWRSLLRRPDITRYSLDEYAADLQSAYSGGFAFGGSSAWSKTEDVETSFTGYVQSIYKSNGPIFAVILARMLLFTEARFCWFEVNDDGENGLPAGRAGLGALEAPWHNAGTAELLARMEQDVSLGGNFYAAREADRLRRLRPDWLTIVLTAPPAEAVQSDVAGYWYHPGRSYTAVERPAAGDVVYLPGEIAHWSPIPDPDAQYRGMSWLQPVVTEVLADKAATRHKLKFFENGATLGTVIAAKENLTPKQFETWKSTIMEQHQGVDRAYKPLFLASPVDVTVQGTELRQLDFKITQGAGETRLCAAGGVPPIIVGLSEGLASATYSNYSTARRKFGDHWASPQWRSAAQALSALVEPPREEVRLGVNTAGIAFLREDQKDAAEIQSIKATTIRQYIDAGFEPDSAVAAVDADNRTLLKHSGLFSVQLQQPGTGTGPAEPAAPEPEPEEPFAEEMAEARLVGEQLKAVATGVTAGLDTLSLVGAVQSGDLSQVKPAAQPALPLPAAPVARHLTHDQKSHGRRGRFTVADLRAGTDVSRVSNGRLFELFGEISADPDPDVGVLERLFGEMGTREDQQRQRRNPLARTRLDSKSEDDLYRLWNEHANAPLAVTAIQAELDRRRNAAADERNKPIISWDQHSADTPEQRQIDRLVGRGRSYRDAYAEVHGLSDEQLASQERLGLVDLERRAGETRRDAVRRVYGEHVHLQYLEAETATRGHLLSSAGRAAGIDPVSLFSGPASRARKYASEDLLRWWADNRRVTYTEFAEQVLTGRAGPNLAGNDRDFGV